MSSELKSKRILITGGAGFIGSHLAAHFLQNNQVRCLDNFSTGFHENIAPLLQKTGFEFIEGDIADFETCKRAVKDMDVVFHQAALGSVPRSIKNPVATNQSNVTGFLNMLEASRLAGVERFIYAASSSTYGDSKVLPKVEDQIGKPLSPYAVTKLVNELYADVFSRLYGMKTIGLRYFNVFGERQSPEGEYAAVIPRFIAAILSGKSLTINGKGEQTRDFTYITNVIQANEKASLVENRDALNQVYNIAFSSRISIAGLAEFLRDYIRTAYGIESPEPIYGDERVGDVRDSIASIEKASRLLGYHPTVDVQSGLKELVDLHFKKNRN